MGVRKRKKEERFEGLIEHWNVEKEENREFGSVWCLDLSVLELSFKVWLEVFWTRRTFLVCILELTASLLGYPIVSMGEEINNVKWCLTLWLVHDKLPSFVSCEQLICFVYLFPSFTFFQSMFSSFRAFCSRNWCG